MDTDPCLAQVWVACDVLMIFGCAQAIHARRIDLERASATTINLYVWLTQSHRGEDGQEQRFWLVVHDVPAKPLLEAAIAARVLSQRLADDRGPLWQFYPLGSPGVAIEKHRVALSANGSRFSPLHHGVSPLYMQGDMKFRVGMRETSGNSTLELWLEYKTTTLKVIIQAKVLIEALIGVEMVELVAERSSGAYELRIPEEIGITPPPRHAAP